MSAAGFRPRLSDPARRVGGPPGREGSRPSAASAAGAAFGAAGATSGVAGVPVELTIGELAERSGVPASTLRYYERHGLLRSRRTTGNQRRYAEGMLRQVAFIRASQRVGISLAEIGGVLGFLPDDTAPTPEFWARAAHCWGRAIDERIAALERRREVFNACADCGCLAFGDCALVV